MSIDENWYTYPFFQTTYQEAMRTIRQEISVQLRRLKENGKWTDADISAETGLTLNHLYILENGYYSDIPLDLLIPLAQFYDKTVHVVLTDPSVDTLQKITLLEEL